MTSSSKRLAFSLALILGGGFLSAVAQAQPVIVREGEGQHRKDCDAMELKPFKTEAWSKLSDWTNGPALTPGDYSGKVVLIVTWADWYPSSVRALALARRLAEQRGKDGLIVVAAHDPQGWKEAKKPAAPKDSTFLLAYDAKGEFRHTIGQDNDPDFFVIDRAGQMRYCDIMTESVETAVDYLLKEKSDEAAGINGKLASDAAARDVERRKTDAIRTSIDLTSLPEVPFTMPSPEAYKERNIGWPKMPRDPNAQPEDPKNPEPAITMNIPEIGFYPSKPQLQGRAVLMYFWHPEVHESFEIMPYMDQLQKEHSRDLVVIGVVCPLKSANGQEVKLDTDPEHIQRRLDEFKRNYRLTHMFLVDLSGSLFTAATGKSQGTITTPWVAVVSSDNTLRWSGSMGQAQFKGALDKVLMVDPGVIAREKAEAQYISTKQSK